MPHFYETDGAAIYLQSFAMIRAEADLRCFSAEEEVVVVRMIHAAGMVGQGAQNDRRRPVGVPLQAGDEEVVQGLATWARPVLSGPGPASLPSFCHRFPGASGM